MGYSTIQSLTGIGGPVNTSCCYLRLGTLPAFSLSWKLSKSLKTINFLATNNMGENYIFIYEDLSMTTYQSILLNMHAKKENKND